MQSTWNATWDAVAYSWGRQSQLWVEIGAVYNGFCKPQFCQKQKDNYSTAYNFQILYMRTNSDRRSFLFAASIAGT